MIGGNTWLHRCKRRCLADLINDVNRPVPVADEHSSFRIEGYTGCNPEVAGKCLCLFEGSDPVNRAIIAAGYVHFSVRAKCYAGGIDYIGKKRLALAFRRDLVDGHRNLLAASSGKRRV